MAIDAVFAELVTRLTEWADFPKYQLERRVDIFLTLFIEEFVGKELGGSAEFVAPEFPLLSRIDPKRPVRYRTSGEPAADTVNVDYLLYLRKPGGDRWVLFELKTDAGSFDHDQLRLYRLARDLPMEAHLGNLDGVETQSEQDAKYRFLKAQIPAHENRGPRDMKAPMQIAYLSPKPRGGFPGEPPRPEPQDGAPRLTRLETQFWTFDDFRRRRPDTHGVVWDHLQPLLDKLVGPRVSVAR